MNGLLLRWGAPLIGAAVALVLIFMLYGSLDFGKFLDGLRSANLIWVVILAVTILLEQIFQRLEMASNFARCQTRGHLPANWRFAGRIWGQCAGATWD